METIARIIVPLVRRLPFKYLYPTGKSQEENTPRYEKHFLEADVIAGDFHFIRRYIPEKLEGKDIITNTVTAEDVIYLREKGIRYLVTTTPEIQGRSFGTNVMEALLVAVSGENKELTPEKYSQLLSEIDFKPRIEKLNENEEESI